MEGEEILQGCKGLPADGFPSTVEGQEIMEGKEKAEGAWELAFASIPSGGC